MSVCSRLGNRLASAIVAVAVIATPLVANSQSGRQKEPPNKKPPTRSSGPVAEPQQDRPRTTTQNQPASTKTTSEVDDNDVVKISSTLVPIPVSVIDPRGNIITNLRLDEFELRVDGQPRPVTDLTRTETPVRLVMLFDNSGSLDAEREFEKNAAMRFFRRVVRPVDEAAIYSIETDSRLAQPLTGNIGLLEQTIATFGRPAGGTSLFDAILGAANYVRPYQGRRVLVIVSDGIETTSNVTDFEDVLKHVLDDNCQVFVVQTGLYESANVRALTAERRMERLTNQTGGAVFIPKTVAELDVAFNEIASDLAHQYILSYYPAPEHRDGRMHAIDIALKSRKDVRVRSRKAYYAPRPGPSAEW
jgi:Ca-activated chloride channel family protein